MEAVILRLGKHSEREESPKLSPMPAIVGKREFGFARDTFLPSGTNAESVFMLLQCGPVDLVDPFLFLRGWIQKRRIMWTS